MRVREVSLSEWEAALWQVGAAAGEKDEEEEGEAVWLIVPLSALVCLLVVLTARLDSTIYLQQAWFPELQCERSSSQRDVHPQSRLGTSKSTGVLLQNYVRYGCTARQPGAT